MEDLFFQMWKIEKFAVFCGKSNKLLELVEKFGENGPLSVPRSPGIGILAQVYFFHTLI